MFYEYCIWSVIMKPNLTTFFLAAVMLMSIGSFANPNNWSGDPSGKFWNNWALTLNGGFTSYYGDLSIYDSDFGKKLKYESKPAFGFMLTKYFTDELGLTGQFLYGGLKSSSSENISFDTKFIEYNAQLRLDLLNLVLRNNRTGLGIVAFGGIGHFLFQSEKLEIEQGNRTSTTHQAQTPEFVYFLGGGLEYIVAERFNVGIDVGVRQAQNDRLDNEISHGDYDYYSYVSVGVTYFFGRNFKFSKKKDLHRRGVKMANR